MRRDLPPAWLRALCRRPALRGRGPTLARPIATLALALTALALTTGCAGPPGEPSIHTPEYGPLRVLIADYDTLHFERKVEELREVEHDNVRPERAADCAMLLAWLANRRGDDAAAIELGGQALDLLTRLTAEQQATQECQVVRADLHFVIGQAYYRRQQVDSSFAHLQVSLDVSRSLGYTHRLIRISLLLGEAAMHLGDLEGCMTQLRAAEMMLDTVSESVIDVPRRMIDYSAAARTALDICNMGYADRMLAKASLYYDRASDRCKTLYIRQLIRQRLAFGQYTQASSALNKAEMLSGKESQGRDLSNEWSYQGLARCRLGELEWALQYERKVDPTRLTSEARLVYTLLCGETAILRGERARAHALLFDSVGSLLGRTQYEQLLIEASRQTYYVSTGDYEQVFNLSIGDRTRLGGVGNETFLQSDRLRDEQLRAAIRPSQDRPALTEKRRSGRQLLAIHLAGLAVVTLLVIRLVKGRERKAEMLNEARNSYLQDQLNTQMFELKKQSKSIEATNKRITESLTYAERIQQAIAPDPAELNDYPISGSFIFYSPLDIVSGDFFWFTRRGDKLVVCCADCTGHGVPGALLTMISTTILSDICEHLEPSAVSPSAILEGLDHSLLENLTHHNGSRRTIKDGLDIAVAVLDLATHELTVAGARRPALVIKGERLYNIRGTKRSIGDTERKVRERPFEETHLQLSQGDKFYLFTDGYSDQFGGKTGEKMKTMRIEQFLRAIHKDDMDEQSLTIQEFFVQWKGDYAQVDDVLFLGVMV